MGLISGNVFFHAELSFLLTQRPASGEEGREEGGHDRRRRGHRRRCRVGQLDRARARDNLRRRGPSGL